MRGGPLFLTVEVGTTGARAVAVDLRARVVGEVRVPYPMLSPRPGFAEQDADAWVDNALSALRVLVTRLPARRVEAIGLTGQTPSVVPVDAAVRPLRNGMLYRDNRAVDEAHLMRERVGRAALHARTGHSPEAFHIGPKLLWLRAHEPEVFAKARWFLQPRDLVLHRLTGRIATDESHAAGTLFFDLVERQWASDLLATFDIGEDRLPPVLTPWSIGGLLLPTVAEAVGLAPCMPVVIGGGDSQCAAFGAGVVAAGPVSEMAGSSSCLNSAVTSPLADERITHYSHVVPGVFTTEVGLNTTGAAIAWAVRALGFRSYQRLAHLASDTRARLATEPDPAGAPRFDPCLGDGERDDPARRGSLSDLSDRHDDASVAFAIVEGVAAAVAGRCELLRHAGASVTELRVTGGGTRLAVLGQLKADLLGLRVRHLDVDASSVGAALLAARTLGHDLEVRIAIDNAVARATIFEPDERLNDALRIRWHMAAELAA